MTRHQTTVEELLRSSSDPGAGGQVPGIVIVFSQDAPAWRVHPLGEDRVVLGRGTLPDGRISRDHAELWRNGGEWWVRDLGSRNGTFLDGRPLQGPSRIRPGQVLRIGNTVGLSVPDVRRFEQGGIAVENGMVVGPALRELLETIARFAQSSGTLLILGESGSGKELAAQAFHRAGPGARGPFLAVNCAAIPEGVAERLLFGARRGAYSGATQDAAGYIQAADGGVLFLDEVGELDQSVQAKLLRVLETREVLALGASTPSRVNVRFVLATHRHLREAVAIGRFRADLFYRIGQPDVRLPPLHERREEIPTLVVRELAACGAGLAPHAKLIERCLLRRWPGNVRELLASVRSAAQRAVAAAESVVRSSHLAEDAGRSLHTPRPWISENPAAPTPERAAPPTAEEVTNALAAQGGNVAAAARALGVHRTQFYRLMKRFGIEPSTPAGNSSQA